MHFCLQWQFFVLQPVRVINLPLIQHGEVAGKKNADEERQSLG